MTLKLLNYVVLLSVLHLAITSNILELEILNIP